MMKLSLVPSISVLVNKEMYNDGINNDFEHAHQKGLRRGFDLGWSYKGRFDRQIIRDGNKKTRKTIQ